MDDSPRAAEDGGDLEDAEEDKDAASTARVPLYFPQHYEATTLGGLVTEIAGHIPLPGEVIEQDGLRFEVIESTDRKVDRLRGAGGEGGGVVARYFD